MINLFNNVLSIGPDFKQHRGGIGAVLSTYHSFDPSFKLLVSFRPGSPISKILIAINSFLRLFVILLYKKEISIIHIHGSHGSSVFRKCVFFLIAKFIFKKKIIYHIHSSSKDIYYNTSNYLYIRIFVNIIKK